MKTQPIILDGPTIRAILDGSTKQVQIPVKPQPVAEVNHCCVQDGRILTYHDRPSGREHIGDAPDGQVCPYGVAKDRLWVKEAWAVPPALNDLESSQIDPKGTIIPGTEGPTHATIRTYKENYRHWNPWPGTKWRSPDCMPRWASRLTLEIMEIGVEQLEKKDEWAWVVGIEKVERKV
jgi:hypothetical protein